MTQAQTAADVQASTAPLLVASQGAVRVLTLNRPSSLNSFTGAMHRHLLQALNDAAQDSQVRAVVLKIGRAHV